MLPRLEAQQPGDLLIGLASSGPHSNGYSLIRRIVERSGLDWEAPAPFEPGVGLAEALMRPTRIYIKSVLPLIRADMIKGCAHITGGGLIENAPRAIAKHLQPRFDWQAWTLPPVFDWLQREGGVADAELRRAFNCGVGLVLVVEPAFAPAVTAALLDMGEEAFVVGELVQAP